MQTRFVEVLSPEEIQTIDGQSRRLLEQVGARVMHDRALDLLEGIGCRVDRSSRLVKFPSEVVQKAIDATPSEFTLYGRDESSQIVIGGDRVTFGPGGFAVFAEDLETGQRRRATRQDLVNHLRLSDALPGCEFNHVNVFPSDVPEATADLHLWAESLIYQTKPIMSENYSARSVDLLVEMASLIRGSKDAVVAKPNICLDVCVISPLTHDRRQVDLLLKGAEYGLPISINAGPIAGGTAPVTMAAVVTQANAEILSAVVIAYAGKPGTPVTYGSWGRHLDMKTMIVTMGGPEFALLKVTTAQMARFYKLPSRGGGALTDSLAVDGQAGYEKMLTTLLPALGGVNYISGMGLNESENLLSLPQLVIDSEIVMMVKRVLQGIAVDADHIATDVIAQAGPGGSFLTNDHTVRFFRELFDPAISNRSQYERWAAAGSPTVRDRAVAKARSLLEHGPEKGLDPKLVVEIRKIVAREETQS